MSWTLFWQIMAIIVVGGLLFGAIVSDYADRRYGKKRDL